MVAAVLMMAGAWPVCRVGGWGGEGGVGGQKATKRTGGLDAARPRHGWLCWQAQRSFVVSVVATESM